MGKELWKLRVRFIFSISKKQKTDRNINIYNGRENKNKKNVYISLIKNMK